MKIKVIFTDLDGTAVDSPKQKVASDRLAKAVESAQAKGISVVAATGRPLSFARPVLKTMKLKGPAIVAGGTVIVDSETEKEINAVYISKNSLEKVLEVSKRYCSKALWNDYEEDAYLVDGGWDISGFNIDVPTYFFELAFVPHEQAVTIVDELKKITDVAVVLVVSQKEGCNDIHVLDKHATKEHAIQEVQKILGVTKSESAGVGDGHNDIHLFNAVGLKIAMANAVEDLITESDDIIGDVKDDGLAEFIEKLVENGGEV